VPGPVHERRGRAGDAVGAGPQRRQAGAQLARPALDAAELGTGGRAGVDDERSGQRW